MSLNASTVGALRTHRKRQLEERAATFGAYDDHGRVFCREDGTAIPPHRVTVEFKKRARQHRLPVMRFHDTRHTAASLMLEAGVDIKVVSDMLGHSTTRITLDIYQHVVRRLHDEAADRVEALVGRTRSRAGQHL